MDNNLNLALKCNLGENMLDNASMALLHKMWLNNNLDEIKLIDTEYFIKCKSGTMVPFNHILDTSQIQNMDREVNRKEYFIFQGLLFSLLNIQNGHLNRVCDCLLHQQEDIQKCPECDTGKQPCGCGYHTKIRHAKINRNNCSSCNKDKMISIKMENQSITIRYLFEKMSAMQHNMTTMQQEINQLKENTIDQIVVVNNEK